MLIGSTRILHFGQNKRATSLKFIPSQSSCGVLSTYPLCPIQPHQCRFLYCNLWAHVKYFSKKCNMHVRMTNLLCTIIMYVCILYVSLSVSVSTFLTFKISISFGCPTALKFYGETSHHYN